MTDPQPPIADEPPMPPVVVSTRASYRVAGIDQVRRRQVTVARGLTDLELAQRAGTRAVGTSPLKRGRRVDIQRYVVYERLTETMSDGSRRRGAWRAVGEHGTVKIEGGIRTGRMRSEEPHVEERDREVER